MAEFAGASSGFSQVEFLPADTPFTVQANDLVGNANENSALTEEEREYQFKETVKEHTRDLQAQIGEDIKFYDYMKPLAKTYEKDIINVQRKPLNESQDGGTNSIEVLAGAAAFQGTRESELQKLTDEFQNEQAGIFNAINSSLEEFAELCPAKLNERRKKTAPESIITSKVSEHVGYEIYVVEPVNNISSATSIKFPLELICALPRYYACVKEEFIKVFFLPAEAKAVKAARRRKTGTKHAATSRDRAKLSVKTMEAAVAELAEANQTIAALRAELAALRPQVYGASTTPPAGTGGNFNGGSVDGALTTRLQDLAL